MKKVIRKVVVQKVYVLSDSVTKFVYGVFSFPDSAIDFIRQNGLKFPDVETFNLLDYPLL